MATRKQNESKFKNWQELPDNGRRYWYDTHRENGYTIRYVKVVDGTERTISLVQELYDAQGRLVQIHEKFPIDQGHRNVGE